MAKSGGLVVIVKRVFQLQCPSCGWGSSQSGQTHTQWGWTGGRHVRCDLVWALLEACSEEASCWLNELAGKQSAVRGHFSYFSS